MVMFKFGTLSIKRWVAVGHDLLWIPVALLLAYWFRYNLSAIPVEQHKPLLVALSVTIPIMVTAFWYFGLYRGIWRFASIPDLMRIIKAVLAGTAVTFVLLFLINRLDGMPRSVMILFPVFLSLGLTGSRLIYRWFKDHRLRLGRQNEQSVLILGAGKAGEMLLRDLQRNDAYLPVGFLDDDAGKLGREIRSVRVHGAVSELEKFIKSLEPEVVLIAMPSASSALLRRILETCNQTQVRCVTLPSLSELADGQVNISRLREISIEDLLGRESVQLDDAKLHKFLQGKRVLVTGAGGSIGSELCRQISRYLPEQLIMLDHAEFNLYTIEQEMQNYWDESKMSVLLGDVRDEMHMRQIFDTFRPEIVFHAAAYKHVPLVESNPSEGIKTNVFGTRQIADLAVEYAVEKFLLVSTDKAVNPTNVMGASKRTAEIYCQAKNSHASTAFITTRFGNVLGSAGSVVPLFRKQIEQGGPVTVTHPEISRFFMTIPEAVSLILQAAAMGQGGEIFVLDMGEPVKIVNLARQMIRLSGHEPDTDIEIKYVGLRPGEKLHEELFHGAENLLGTAHPKIMQAQARVTEWDWLQLELAGLVTASASGKIDDILNVLQRLVPEFQQGSEDSTLVHNEPKMETNLHQGHKIH